MDYVLMEEGRGALKVCANCGRRRLSRINLADTGTGGGGRGRNGKRYDKRESACVLLSLGLSAPVMVIMTVLLTGWEKWGGCWRWW